MKRRSTLCAHAGEHAPGMPAGIKAHAPPIYQTSGFEYPSHVEAEAAGRGEVYIYSRDANPTEDRLAHAIAELEMTEDACIFSSGMGAISAALLTYAQAGGHVVSTEGLYGVTHAFITEHLLRFGVTHTLVAGTAQAIDGAITPATRVVHIESITNPLLRVADLDAIAAVCRARGVPLVVDATFATPLGQRPIERGALLSVHSATKYIGGHGDLLLGVVSGPKSEIAKVRKLRKLQGGSADPFAAWLALRGLRTMALRVERQVASALTVARALEHTDGVERVFYPTLPSHPDHEIAARVLDGGGAMVSFEVAGGLDGARRCYDRLRLIARAASLGDVTSLMTHPATFSHNKLSDIERRRFGISDGLLRLSIGIEDAADLVDDLRQSLG
ncbi:MAG: Cystathionine gamma-synthase [Myxococcales bacterium]|nr:Cystathionine gamma-synthase [Myxococcales bacterium]